MIIDTIEEKSDLPWTGERLVTKVNNHIGMIEHLHRYSFAMNYISGKYVLDIASGEGYGSNLMSSVALNVVGVDISIEAVSFASQKYVKQNLEFKQGSADNIPIPSSSIDVVVSFETLEHHEKHEEMMLEIKRVLKLGGLLIMSSPEKTIYGRRDPNNIYHVKELRFDQLENLLSKYFKNNMFLDQKVIYGSLLTIREAHSTVGINFLNGNYNEVNNGLISETDFLNQPFFNISLSSDDIVPKIHSSFYDAAPIYEEEIKIQFSSLNNRIAQLENKIGGRNRYTLFRLMLKVCRFLYRDFPI